MKEIFEKSLEFWMNYWNESMIVFFFIIAFIYLLLFKRKDKEVKYILIYTALAMAVFFCPISAKIIQKGIGSSVYWRVLWIVPFAPVIALAATKFIIERKCFLQPVLVILFAGLIAVCGKGFLGEGYYEKVNNYQQVPDEVAGICELVRNDTDSEEIFLAADDYVSSYIRVYDPSINMFFGRRGAGFGDEGNDRSDLYNEINAQSLNYAVIGECGKKLSCNYLVVKIPDDEQKSELEKSDYHELGAVGRYSVFRLGNSADEYRSSFVSQIM